MSGVEIALAAAAVAGTGMSIYGQISGAQAQAEAAKRNAELKNQQANELLAREAINEAAIRKVAGITATRYSSAAAATGFEGGGVGGQVEIFMNAQDAITNSQREAFFKASMLRQGAEIEASLASDAVTAAWITGAGSLLTTGAQVGSMYAKPGKGTKLTSDTGGSD